MFLRKKLWDSVACWGNMQQAQGFVTLIGQVEGLWKCCWRITAKPLSTDGLGQSRRAAGAVQLKGKSLLFTHCQKITSKAIKH